MSIKDYLSAPTAFTWILETKVSPSSYSFIYFPNKNNYKFMLWWSTDVSHKPRNDDFTQNKKKRTVCVWTWLVSILPCRFLYQRPMVYMSNCCSLVLSIDLCMMPWLGPPVPHPVSATLCNSSFSWSSWNVKKAIQSSSIQTFNIIMSWNYIWSYILFCTELFHLY